MLTEHLVYLVVAAECGSMRKAAQKLYCSQPAISSAINALEEELGFKLFERTNTGIKPTPKAGVIIDDARQILTVIESWTKDQKPNQDNEISGSISCADNGEIGLTFFSDIAIKINELYPKITMHMADPGNILQRINLGVFDIAILPVPPGQSLAIKEYLKKYHWLFEPLYRADYELLVSTENEISRFENVDAYNLYGAKILLHKDFPYMNFLSSLREKSEISYSDTNVLINEVISNRAVGIFPPSCDSFINELENTGLIRRVHINSISLPLDYYLIYWERLLYEPAGKIIINEVKTRFSVHQNLNLTFRN